MTTMTRAIEKLVGMGKEEDGRTKRRMKRIITSSIFMPTVHPLHMLTVVCVCLVLCWGCSRDGVGALSESRLSPIAWAVSFAQERDLIAAGVELRSDGSEFELAQEQVQAVLAVIRARVDLRSALPSNLKLAGYRFFLKKVQDPIIAGSRTERGHPRPFMVTVYEVGADGRLDRSRDMFFVS
jgi:hypothetical protein